MTIIDFAIYKERIMENYYRDLAEQTADQDFSKIFLRMAHYEASHVLALENIDDIFYADIESLVLPKDSDIYNILNLKDNQFKFILTQADLYQKLLKIELDSERFYREAAKEELNENNRNLLLKLADEENKHANFIEALLDQVIESETKIENAEFNYFEKVV